MPARADMRSSVDLQLQRVAGADLAAEAGAVEAAEQRQACPAKRSSVRTAIAPAWAMASHMSTPGSVGRPGKWPAKNHSSPVRCQRART